MTESWYGFIFETTIHTVPKCYQLEVHMITVRLTFMHIDIAVVQLFTS